MARLEAWRPGGEVAGSSPTSRDHGRSDGGLLAREAARRQAAWRVLERLDLLRRWARYGEPRVVGSVALRVVVRPDIDLAILTDAPWVEDGFAVVTECAAMPRVLRGRFRRDLTPGDPSFPSGLYWKVDYQADDGVVWTIDMWLLERGPGGGLDSTTRLGRLLTDDRRAAVLAIKEAAAAQHRRVPGFTVYQAVLAGGAGSLEELDRWVASREGGPWRAFPGGSFPGVA
jgi:hypothetical protein